MIRKKYEVIQDMLKKERLKYTKQINKMESFLAKQVVEITSLEKDYEEAVQFRDEIRGEQKEWEDLFTEKLLSRHSKLTETKKNLKDRKEIFNSLETIFSKTESDRKPGSDSDRASTISKKSTSQARSLWPSASEVTLFPLTTSQVSFISVIR